MKRQFANFVFILALIGGYAAEAQDNQVLFKNTGVKSSGAYGAITNQFTTIDGKFANMTGIYGGWFVNRKWMVGFGAAATTNHIAVPSVLNNFPAKKMTYQYGQAGLMTEYVVASTKLVHFNFNLLTGTGFSFQYDRQDFDDWDFEDWDDDDNKHKPDFFFIVEPGVQVEFNLLKWMRFSPGVSYRKSFGANKNGLTDADISNISYNLTFKFGKF